jgi:hypothetical protein
MHPISMYHLHKYKGDIHDTFENIGRYISRLLWDGFS